MAGIQEIKAGLIGRLQISEDEKAEKARFGTLLDRIAGMEGGEEALTKMASNACRFYFEPAGPGKEAGFLPALNAIFMNAGAEETKLAAAFLEQSHRAAAHAEQGGRETLKKALWAQKRGEHDVFDRMIDAAYQTAVGREILDKVAGLDYSFCFENLSQQQMKGVCFSDRRQIVLNSACRTEDLVTTFIHEACHAVQNASFPKDASKLNAAARIKTLRAVEADACAHQALFAHQLKEVWPRAYEVSLESPLMQVFVHEKEKGAGDGKAAEAVFKAWYDVGAYQHGYEKDHKNLIRATCRQAMERGEKGFMQEPCSNEEILSVCRIGGRSYVAADFLSSDKACAVFRSTREEIADAAQKLAAVTGEKPDMTAAALPVREDFVPKTPQKERFEASEAFAAGRTALVFGKTVRGRG